jgi:uncharacterized protein (TIGR03437 family)
MMARLFALALFTAALGFAQISFQPPLTSPALDGPVAMVTADFNGDGVPDLAVSDTGSHVLTILLGNGDGTFQQAAAYPIASDCQMASIFVGDFTSDHKPDLLGICQFENQVLVFPGHGDGTFGASIPTELPALAFAGYLFLETIPAGLGGSVGDFNGDGKLDLVVLLINDLPPDLSSFPPLTSAYFVPGKGDGTFGTAVSIPPAGGAINMTSGDFNGDGKVDLACLTYTTGENADGTSTVTQTLFIAVGNGDGTFQRGPTYSWTGATFAIAAADLNGDGFLDLYSAGASLATTATSGTLTSEVTVMLGDGKGNFTQGFMATDPANDLSNSYCLGDFSGKGGLDLLETMAASTGDGTSTDAVLGLRPGDGKGGFQSLQTFPGPNGIFPFSSVCADLNGDGLADAAFTGNSFGQVVGVFSGAINLASLTAALANLPAGELYVSLNASPGAARTFSNTNSASFVSGPLAANSIATAFWSGPKNVSGIGVNVRDSAGQTRAAQIFFASSTQINYLIPDGTALGQATVSITGAPNPFSAPLKIVAVAPGVYNAGGLAVGNFDTVSASGNQTFTNLVNAGASGAPQTTPIDVTAGQVFLTLFGTGIRNHANAVTAIIGTTTVPVAYAGAQGKFVGEDQINIQLPASLAGAGLVNVTLNVDGQTANPVQIQIK